MEHLTLEAKVHGIGHTVGQIYGLIAERFGHSDRKAQRLRALKRKLTEVMALLAEQARMDITADAQRSERIDPSKPYANAR
jgi:hypothetical protein